MDPIDERLLQALVRDPRISVTELGKAIGLSRPSTAERLAHLERDGVITAWRVELNATALGRPYTVFVRIRPNAGQSDDIERLVRATPAVVECYRTTGEDSFLLKMHVATIPEFEEIVGRLGRYGQTTAVDVLSTVITPREPPFQPSVTVGVATTTG